MTGLLIVTDLLLASAKTCNLYVQADVVLGESKKSKGVTYTLYVSLLLLTCNVNDASLNLFSVLCVVPFFNTVVTPPTVLSHFPEAYEFAPPPNEVIALTNILLVASLNLPLNF